MHFVFKISQNMSCIKCLPCVHIGQAAVPNVLGRSPVQISKFLLYKKSNLLWDDDKILAIEMRGAKLNFNETRRPKV